MAEENKDENIPTAYADHNHIHQYIEFNRV